MDQNLFIFEASRSLSDITHFFGLLCTSDRPFAETATTQHITLSRDLLQSPTGGGGDSNPPIPSSERPQTHALDRAATGTGATVPYTVTYNDTHTRSNDALGED